MDSDEPSFIELVDVSKRFGDVVAVDSVSLAIRRGELFSILGGSGCGKTTLLRMLAGFEAPDSGTIVIDGSDVTEMPPYERPVNLMFQSYALFPHMSVFDNVAYGLRRARIDQARIRSRVDEMLEMLRIGELAKRRPDQLSGGERQRVALARALVRRPKVLLLDEPLAALDRKLREHTQFELASIQYDLGITFVVVTHDQDEAMTLSSRIAVMNAGRLCQVGAPREVYEYPQSRFVAEFIGTINQFDGTVVGADGGSVVVEVPALGRTLMASCDPAPAVGAGLVVAVRPEKIFISKSQPERAESAVVRGVVLDLGYFGNRSLYQVRVGDGKTVLVSAQNRERSVERKLEWDDEVWLTWTDASSVLLTE